MSGTVLTDFSAREPSLGYFYQIKYALLALLNSTREMESPKVRIENLDDVEIENMDSVHLYQTKMHVKGKANLTDSSVDFWKTMRIWAEHLSNGLIDIDNTFLNLITTEFVPEDSILSKFKSSLTLDTEIEEVINRLDQICINSTNQTNFSAYQAYQALSLENKKRIVKKVRISDNSMNVTEIDEGIKKQLALSTYPRHLDAFLEMLQGWWFKKSIDNLTGTVDWIDGAELQLKIANIRDSFQADNLPNHFPEQLEISDEEVSSLRGKDFIKQLELVQISQNSRTVKRAISDFRRAFEQRSKWLRLQLLNPQEEEDFDRRLKDYWQNIFDIMCDEANEKGIEDMQALGKKFYLDQFAVTCPQIKIREKFNEDFLTRGSYQMLSDGRKIGWHPQFKDIL